MNEAIRVVELLNERNRLIAEENEDFFVRGVLDPKQTLRVIAINKELNELLPPEIEHRDYGDTNA